MNLVEVHILQSVPPSNLNRDDTGSPKDAVFGGVRRARISSQAQKRAVREAFPKLIPGEPLAVRTRLLVDELVKRFSDRPESEVRAVVLRALKGIGFSLDANDRTKYLLFLGNQEIDELAKTIKEHWNALRPIEDKPAVNTTPETPKKAPTSEKEQKKAAREQMPSDVRKALEPVLNGGKAVDLALFGRMLADRPELTRDAACQVAHAISTHRVDREFDFYTAVDDLSPCDNAGAGMMGDVEYCSATFYRYANVNLDLLRKNLQGETGLATKAVKAFLKAFIETLPSGKQNSFAAHSLPEFVGLLARGNAAPRNLAVAFEKPVFPRDGKSLTEASVEALMRYWQTLDIMYGRPEQEQVVLVNRNDVKLSHPSDQDSAKIAKIENAICTIMNKVEELLKQTPEAG